MQVQLHSEVLRTLNQPRGLSLHAHALSKLSQLRGQSLQTPGTMNQLYRSLHRQHSQQHHQSLQVLCTLSHLRGLSLQALGTLSHLCGLSLQTLCTLSQLHCKILCKSLRRY